MKVNMITAMAADNGLIGIEKDGVHGLPWYVPGDLKQFKEKTKGCPVIMGRHTFDSFGFKGGLPWRLNVVVTTNSRYLRRNRPGHPDHSDRVMYVATLNDAHERARAWLSASDKDTAWLIGGNRLITAWLSDDYPALGVDEYHLTLINPKHITGLRDGEIPIFLNCDLHKKALVVFSNADMELFIEHYDFACVTITASSSTLTFHHS